MNFALFRRSNASSLNTTLDRLGVCVSVLSVVSFPCPGCWQNVNEGYNMMPEFFIEIVVPILCFAMLYFTFTVTCDFMIWIQAKTVNCGLFKFLVIILQNGEYDQIFDACSLSSSLSSAVITLDTKYANSATNSNFLHGAKTCPIFWYIVGLDSVNQVKIS